MEKDTEEGDKNNVKQDDLYALFVDKKIVSVFSSKKSLEKWAEIIYKPLYPENSVFEMEVIKGIQQDENYSIYLVKDETMNPLYFYFGNLSEAKAKFDKIIEENKGKHKKKTFLNLVKIIIDYPYTQGCLYQGLLTKYPKSFFGYWW